MQFPQPKAKVKRTRFAEWQPCTFAGLQCCCTPTQLGCRPFCSVANNSLHQNEHHLTETS